MPTATPSPSPGAALAWDQTVWLVCILAAAVLLAGLLIVFGRKVLESKARDQDARISEHDQKLDRDQSRDGSGHVLRDRICGA